MRARPMSRRLSGTDSAHSHLRFANGNTFFLVAAGVAVLILLAAFVIIYSKWFVLHQQAQTAIDASALQVANDMSRIVVDQTNGTNFGPVGLMDDAAVGNDPNKRSVRSINTIMATIRLDAIVADLLNNKTMAVLAAEDLLRARQDSLKLRNAIIAAVDGEGAKDKNGQIIKLKTSANNAYDANVRLNGITERLDEVKVTIGTIKPGYAQTSTPTPCGDVGENKVAGSHYPAYSFINTKVAGQTLQFVFASVADSAKIVDSGSFVALNESGLPDYVVPACVEVSTREANRQTATTTQKKGSQEKRESITVSARAEVGGRPASSFNPSGSLVLGFPQTIPASGNGVDFTSVQSIMNNSQIDFKNTFSNQGKTSTARSADVASISSLGTQSPYKGWNNRSPGDYLRATEGSVPSQAGASMRPKNLRGRLADDPSVVLSICVYDWLKNMALRPCPQEVVTALSTPLSQVVGNSAQAGHDSFAFDLMGRPNRGFIEPAYALQQEHLPVTFGIVNVPPDGIGDPRDQRHFMEDPNAYRRQIANIFGYVPAAPTLSDRTMLVSIGQDGSAVTTNGQPMQTLIDFQHEIYKMNGLAADTAKLAQKVAKGKVAEAREANDAISAIRAEIKKKGGSLSSEEEQDEAMAAQHKKKQKPDAAHEEGGGQGEAGSGAKRQMSISGGESIDQLRAQLNEQGQKRDKAMKKAQRSMNTLVNAVHVMDVAAGMINDLKSLSVTGVTKTGNHDYKIVNGQFSPPTRVPTEQEFEEEGKINMGQSGPEASNDWAFPLSNNGQSQISVYTRTNVASSRSSDGGNLWVSPGMPPVMAQQAFNLNEIGQRFMFVAVGEKIKVTHLGLEAYGENILKDQYEYQNTAAKLTPVKSVHNSYMDWNCIARLNGANDSGAYYADSHTPGYSGTAKVSFNFSQPGRDFMQAAFADDSSGYPLISEWTIRCPAPVCPDPNEKTSWTYVHSGGTAKGSMEWKDGKNTVYALKSVTPSVNPANNDIAYYLGPENVGKPEYLMHFYTDFEEWWKAIQMGNAGQNTAAGTDSIQQIADELDLGTVDQIPKTREKALEWWNTYKLITNTGGAAQDREITELNRNGAPARVWGTNVQLQRWMAYLQLVFYTIDDYGCQRMFRWSS